MVIFHSYFSLPEGTWIRVEMYGIFMGTTWEIDGIHMDLHGQI